MPRPVSRRYEPYLKVFIELATDSTLPAPIRLRAAELGLAIRAERFDIAAGKAAANAVRDLVARDSIDKQLFELTGIIRKLQQQITPAVDNETADTTEPETESGIESVFRQAAEQRKLRAIADDENLSLDLRTAATEQLHNLGSPPIHTGSARPERETNPRLREFFARVEASNDVSSSEVNAIVKTEEHGSPLHPHVIDERMNDPVSLNILAKGQEEQPKGEPFSYERLEALRREFAQRKVEEEAQQEPHD